MHLYFLFLLKIAIIRNNISYWQFKSALEPFRVFSLAEIKKVFRQFDSKRLVEWQSKGYIRRLINKWYYFSDVTVTEHFLFRVSNCLHHPSYISMESALAYYHVIPEAVYSPQGVSTRKTVNYNTVLGAFHYRSIKPELYFGYQILIEGSLPALIADLEKALLDYLYFNNRINTSEDLASLRFNVQVLQENLDWEKLFRYAAIFDSATLDNRIQVLKKTVLNAYTS